MLVTALGYIGIGGTDLDKWSEFATRQLGLQQVDGGSVTRSFRMDDRKQRIIADKDAVAERYFGWEVRDAAALDAVAHKLEAAGVPVRQEPASIAGRRCVADLISFSDPDGNRLEVFHGAMLADSPFKPAWDISGFRTGTQGLGHAVLMVRDFDAAMAFYQGILGFQVSDFMRQPVKAAFLHVNTRHHSLALFEHPQRTGMHHVMMELYSLDDVGQGYDRALRAQERVAVTLGRHHNDYMTSFYMRTPSNFLVEYGWGAREVQPENWQPEEMTTLASFWGHDGLMRSVAGDGPPPDHLPPPPPEGRRAPVQVMEGNYARLSGVCPWWDSVASAG
jgi:2,3-dihydroxybiphenyl 1,2-dioxygenase